MVVGVDMRFVNKTVAYGLKCCQEKRSRNMPFGIKLRRRQVG